MKTKNKYIEITDIKEIKKQIESNNCYYLNIGKYLSVFNTETRLYTDLKYYKLNPDYEETTKLDKLINKCNIFGNDKQDNHIKNILNEISIRLEDIEEKLN